jgi:predicted RNA-binding protein with PUA-like domain
LNGANAALLPALRAAGARRYSPAMACYIFKTEPGTYSYDDLVKDKRAVWDGIANAVALKHLRGVKKGDTVLIYHTGDEKQVVGIAKAVSDAYPDPKSANAKAAVVDLQPVKLLPKPVTLATFREDGVLQKTELVRISRLSVVPIDDAQLARILKLAGA